MPMPFKHLIRMCDEINTKVLSEYSHYICIIRKQFSTLDKIDNCCNCK